MSKFGVFVRLIFIICIDVFVEKCSQRPEEGNEPFGPGITGGRELPHMDARNQTRVLWKDSK